MNSNEIDEESKKTFNDLLCTTFLEKVDHFSKSPQWINSAGLKPQDYLLENFLIKFICSKNKSIFFSLNQDLFIERQCIKLFQEYQSDNSYIKSKLSGMRIDDYPIRNLKRLGVSDAITAKNLHTPLKEVIVYISEENTENAKDCLKNWKDDNEPFTYYLKLHGSLDYYYNEMPLFITGEKKSGRIASCSLTKFYSETFDETLKENSCKLIIIGYGFHDEHINHIISTFLKKPSNDNELHIVDNINMQEFMKKIVEKGMDPSNLKKKLKSYHPNALNVYTLASFIEPNLLRL